MGDVTLKGALGAFDDIFCPEHDSLRTKVWRTVINILFAEIDISRLELKRIRLRLNDSAQDPESSVTVDQQVDQWWQHQSKHEEKIKELKKQLEEIATGKTIDCAACTEVLFKRSGIALIKKE